MRSRRSFSPRPSHTLSPGLQALYDLPDIPPRRRVPIAATLWRTVAAAMVLCALLAWPIFSARAADAQAGTDDDIAIPAKGSRWGLGAAAVTMQKPYRGVDPETFLLPALVYESKWWTVYGPSVSLNVPSWGPLALSLTTRLSHEGYDASDSRYLAGMRQRKDGLWLGGSAKWRTACADTTVEWMGDVSGYSHGSRLALSVECIFDLGRFELTPRIGAALLDRRYVDYYYGVQPFEVRADRALYRPRATVNLEIGLRAAYRVARRDALFLDLGVDRLGTQIRRSPLVDDATQSRIVLGYVHVF